MSTLSSTLLEETQREIVRLFAEVYTPPGDFPRFALRAGGGDPPPFHSMAAEFGDFAPFLHLAGAPGYVREQTTLLARFLLSGRALVTPYVGAKRFFLPARSNSFHYTDLLLGLADLHALTGEKRMLDLACAVFDGVREGFEEDGWICQWRFPGLGIRVPVAESVSALFAELALDLAAGSARAAYRDWALAAIDRLLDLEFFKRTGLFPVHVEVRASPWRKAMEVRDREARLAKHNLAAAAAMLAAFRTTGENRYRETLARWHKGVREHFLLPEGGAASRVTFSRDFSVASKAKPHLKNHGLADLLCDLARFVSREPFLETAVRLGDFWLGQQASETGLLPYEPGGTVSFLDGETDWTVALLKIHELTGEARYREAAERILAGVLAHHRTEKGFVNGVDIRTGAMRDDLIETRYGSLLLKPILFLQSGKRIYDDADAFWWRMLLDR